MKKKKIKVDKKLKDRNRRRLDLHLEIGALLNSIVVRETSAGNTVDLLDVLLTHTCEIMAIHYKLTNDDALHCYNQMRTPVQAFISQAIGEPEDGD